jgi:hypothetical protein
MERRNCWEYFNCGREPEGENAEEFGICPATFTNNFDGVNNGKNCGRLCWIVAGSFCKGEISGTYAQKLHNCINCDFLKYVNEEEGREFILTPKNYNYRNKT